MEIECLPREHDIRLVPLPSRLVDRINPPRPRAQCICAFTYFDRIIYDVAPCSMFILFFKRAEFPNLIQYLHIHKYE